MIIVDANLLIYAVNRDDPRHDVVRRWWEALLSGHAAVGIPWVVALAFVRIATRRGLPPRSLTVEQATDYVAEWTRQPHVSLPVPGPRRWPTFAALVRRSAAAGTLTADAHIAALAIENGATVARADGDFVRFEQASLVDPLRPDRAPRGAVAASPCPCRGPRRRALPRRADGTIMHWWKTQHTA